MNIFFPVKNSLHIPFLFLILTLAGNPCSAQLFPQKNYPKGYFIYPVDAKIALAANFGELRPNHYHMGLDCKTDHVQNKIVKAAADGYVAHVSISPEGFGQAIYINHPNGLTTVYGHLNKFFPALGKYVKDQQYKQESWQVYLNIPPGMFPVKKGQFIAYSGNTGGSQGPHCHFEIRDTKTGKVLNELLFGLPIPDNVPPTIVRVALYNRNISTYSQSPKLFPVEEKIGVYKTIPELIITNSNRISFGISANDKQSGSNNPNGIYEAILYVDEKPVDGFRIDSITYDETRYVNAHIDYKTRAAGGPYIEHLSRLPGYPQGVYKDFNGDGVITLNNDSVHAVKIIVKDPNENTSVVEFKIKRGFVNATPGNTSYENPFEFKPGVVNVFDNDKVQLFLQPEALYDSFAFKYSEMKTTNPMAYSDVYALESGLVPVHNYFSVRIKPAKPIPAYLQNKMIIKQSWKNKHEVAKAVLTGGMYAAQFRNFGDFVLLADDVPPIIHCSFHDNANLSRASRIVIVPKDNNESIKNFRAELDGKWLMFTNDKGRAFIYTFDEKCSRGKHELKISVEDEAGNTAEKIYHFIR